MNDINELIGRDYNYVKLYLMKREEQFRTLKEDEKDYMVTDDLVPERINLVVNNNTITEAYYG